MHTFVQYDYSLRHLKQIRLRHRLQSLLKIFDCGTDAENTNKTETSRNNHVLDCGV